MITNRQDKTGRELTKQTLQYLPWIGVGDWGTVQYMAPKDGESILRSVRALIEAVKEDIVDVG